MTNDFRTRQLWRATTSGKRSAAISERQRKPAAGD
jgi:hypothetical protein